MVDSDEITPMTGEEESDNEEEDDNVADLAGEPMEHDGDERGFMAGVLECLMERFPVLKTREGRAGLVHNFLRGLQLLSTPVPSKPEAVVEAADQMTAKAKRIYMVDSGLVFNSPYPLLLRPQRTVDIFLSFDFSGREKDDEMPFRELLLAEKWAKKNNLKFPPIDAEEQYKKYGMKEFYVFRHPSDFSCPIIIHFTLVNKTFKEQSAPGVERRTRGQNKYADFSIFEDPEGWYSTFNFNYPKEQFNKLADLNYFNTLLGEETIKDVMAECVQKRQADATTTGYYNW